MPATAKAAMRSLCGLAALFVTLCVQTICAGDAGAEPALGAAPFSAPQAMVNGNSRSAVGAGTPTTADQRSPRAAGETEYPARANDWPLGMESRGDATRSAQPGAASAGGAQTTAANRPSGGARISPPDPKSALPLPAKGDAEGAGGVETSGAVSSILKMAASLGVALGLFLVVAWLMRRAAPNGSQVLPGEVVELLGRAPLAGRQQVQLLRVGRKLILVAVSQAGAETLTEIVDPEEVDRLAGLCRKSHPQSATEAFRQVFRQFAGQRSGDGFVDTSGQGDARLAGLGHARRMSRAEEARDA